MIKRADIKLLDLIIIWRQTDGRPNGQTDGQADRLESLLK